MHFSSFLVQRGLVGALLVIALAACNPTTATTPKPTIPTPTVAVGATVDAPVPTALSQTTTTSVPVPATPVPATPAPTGLDQSIRATDWNAAFAADARLHIDMNNGMPYLTVIEGPPKVSGIPEIDRIVYGDFDSNGIEEAAIPLDSGGTAGNIGFLLFRQAAPIPQLIAWQDGYKQLLSLTDGHLVSRDALYGAWDANCCPSGFLFITYALQGDSLTVAANHSEPVPGTHVVAVQHFYERLAQHDFNAAYAMLGDTFKQANPYDAWAAGYANTSSLTADVTPDAANPNLARVALTAIDTKPDGGQVTQHFAGTWLVQWDANRTAWALTEANMAAQ